MNRRLIIALTVLLSTSGLTLAPRAEAAAPYSVHILETTVVEGVRDSVVFEVVNSGSEEAILTYQTFDGSSPTDDGGWDPVQPPALAGSDYTATSGQLTIGANQVGTIIIPVSAEAGPDDDSDHEWFHVQVAPVRPTGVIAKDKADAIIIDDDLVENPPIPDAGVPQISVANGARAEGDSGQPIMRFKVSTSEAVPFPMALNWATSEGTADAGDDYVDSSGNITIEAGKTEAWIEVPIRGDTIYEDSERFEVGINSLAWFMFITDNTASGTIVNDDPLPTLRVTNVRVEEGERAVFRVLRSNGSENDVSFAFATRSGSADSGKDFASLSGHRDFGDTGDLEELVSIRVRNDSRDEDGERFLLRISGAEGARIVDETGAARIIDND